LGQRGLSETISAPAVEPSEATPPMQGAGRSLHSLAAAGTLALAFGAAFAGAAGALLAAATLALSGLLVKWITRPGNASERGLVCRAAQLGSALAPAGLVVFLSFNAGGFFPAAPAFVAALLALAVALQALLIRRPFEGFGRGLTLAVGALALFALWTLLSGLQADAPGRALVEFQRAAMYVLVVVVAGAPVRSRHRIAWMVRGIAVGIAIVCTVALTTRLLPRVWPIAAEFANNRLSYPLTYWNALGLLAAIGVILALHLTATTREPRGVRVAAAAALPILAPTLLFTFSRGAIAACVVGIAAYVLVGRPHALTSALLGSAPATAVTVSVAYHSDQLTSVAPTTAAAVQQGQHVAATVAVCAASAALLRALLLPLDSRMARTRVPTRIRRPVTATAWGMGGLIAIIVALALHLPDTVGHEYHRFLTSDAVAQSRDLRTRLTDPSNSHRLESWRVAWHGFQSAELAGHGPGSYAALWAHTRPIPLHVLDAHSLYLEVFDELGIVGFALLVGGVGTLLVVAVTRCRRPERSIYAAVAAVGIAWILRAGIDWDWEVPAVTVPFLALAGGAAATRTPTRRPLVSPALVRIGVVFTSVAVGAVATVLSVASTRLDNGIRAYQSDDCARAAHDARSSISLLPSLSEGHEIVGLCVARDGRPGKGLAELRGAVRAEPDNWHFKYTLGLVQAAAGLDARGSLQSAAAANPLDAEPKLALRELTHASRQQRRKRAATLLRDASLYEVR
jgi:O-antigen ligase